VDVLQQIAAVCLVIGLAVLAASLSRKGAGSGLLRYRWGASGSGRMEVVQRLMLTPQHSICIIRIDGRELTVGLHPGGITVMTSEPGSDSK
jgi:flagellar biogenesis protein FliO